MQSYYQSNFLYYKGSKRFIFCIIHVKYIYKGSKELKYYISKGNYYYFTKISREKLVCFVVFCNTAK